MNLNCDAMLKCWSVDRFCLWEHEVGHAGIGQIPKGVGKRVGGQIIDINLSVVKNLYNNRINRFLFCTNV